MTRRRSAALAAPLALLLLTACTAGPETTSKTPTATAPSAAFRASPSATPTVTPTPAVEATCENTVTAEHLETMASNGWVSWSTDAGSPLDAFPSGAPAGHLTCTWGADPDLVTDNVLTLAWAPIDEESAAAAQSSLLGQGYERVEATEGVYLVMRGGPWVDADGFSDAYLFTGTDVRWAVVKDLLKLVKAPGEPAA